MALGAPQPLDAGLPVDAFACRKPPYLTPSNTRSTITPLCPR